MSAKPFSLAVKAVITDGKGCCLLLRRSKVNKHFVGCWEWPGGKVDAGEDFASAVVREVREEAALDVEIAGLAGATSFEMERAHVVLLCMEARVVAGEIRLSEEHDAFAWVAWADMPNYEFTGSITPFVLAYAKTRGGAP